MDAPLYALLIGVDDYPHPDVPPLFGCVNDVDAMQRLLVDILGVAEEHVRRLTDRGATREAISAAVTEHLIARGEAWRRAGEPDPPPAFLLYFSGHGSQARDHTGREPDGYHETLVPHDARGSTVFDIRDLEVAAWLDQLVGDNTTVILDCCHSGSATRRAVPGDSVRAAPADQRPQTDLLAGAPGPAVGGVGSARHVLLAACRDHQQAYEYRDGDQVRGAFSHVLVRELATLAERPEVTYRQLHERVRFAVNDARPGQTPQCEGDVDRVVFGRERRPWSAHATVVGVRDGGVWLDVGRAHGITTDSLMALETTEPRTSTVLVEHVEPVRCAGRVLEGRPPPARGTGAHLATLDLGAHRWRLHLAAATAPALAPLRAAMRTDPLRGLVTPADDVGAADLLARAEGDEAILEDAVGRRLVASADPLGFVLAVAHVARFTWSLRAERPSFGPDVRGRVGLMVRAVDTDVFGERVTRELPFDPDLGYQVAAGTRLAFEFANPLPGALHVALAAFTSDWHVTVLHPAVPGAQDRLGSRRTFAVGLGERSFSAALPPGVPRATDRLRLLATTHPCSVDPLALVPPPAVWEAAGPLPEPPGGRAPLPDERLRRPRRRRVPSRWMTADALLTTHR